MGKAKLITRANKVLAREMSSQISGGMYGHQKGME